MKQFYLMFAFLVFAFFFQCRLPDYYIKNEKPDAAFHFASKKLDNKKQKTKHLQTLEYGFNATNERDIALIEELKKNHDLRAWKRIHYINQEMLARHEKNRAFFASGERGGLSSSF